MLRRIFPLGTGSFKRADLAGVTSGRDQGCRVDRENLISIAAGFVKWTLVFLRRNRGTREEIDVRDRLIAIRLMKSSIPPAAQINFIIRITRATDSRFSIFFPVRIILPNVGGYLS